MNAILLTLLGFFPPPGVFGEPVAVAPLVQTRETTLVLVAPPEVPVVWPGARRVAARGLPMLGDLSGPGGTLRIYEDGVLPGVPRSVATDGASVVVTGAIPERIFARRIDPGGVVRRIEVPPGVVGWAAAAGEPAGPLRVVALTTSTHLYGGRFSEWTVRIYRVQDYGGLQLAGRTPGLTEKPADICTDAAGVWLARLDGEARRVPLMGPEPLDEATWPDGPRRLAATACATTVGPVGPVEWTLEGAGPRAGQRITPDLPAWDAERGMTRIPWPAVAAPGIRWAPAVLSFPGADALIEEPPVGVPGPGSSRSGSTPGPGDDGPWTAESNAIGAWPLEDLAEHL